MANIKGLMGSLILVIVGSILFPVVESFCTTAAGTNTSATKYAIWNVMPVFFILLVPESRVIPYSARTGWSCCVTDRSIQELGLMA
jgi:hypothetical protein